MTLKAIQTRYKGYHFRSRLEARWAVFFDALGVPWEYEKEGYDLGDAGYYLPDFWLPTVRGCLGAHEAHQVPAMNAGVWLEIKGVPFRDIPEGELLKAATLERASGAPVIVATNLAEYAHSPHSALPHLFLARCPNHCGLWGFYPIDDETLCKYCSDVLDKCNYSTFIGGCDAEVQDQSGEYHSNENELTEGRCAARSARFEHGSRGAT
jgi:hypothetical protein